MKNFDLEVACKVFSQYVAKSGKQINHNYLAINRTQDVDGVRKPEFRSAPVGMILADIFRQQTRQWFDRLTSEDSDYEWTVIKIDPYQSILEFEANHLAAPSFSHALGYVLQMIDAARGAPTKVIKDDNGISIFDTHGEMARIEKINFDRINDDNVGRGAKALSKIYTSSDLETHRIGLKKVEGLESCVSVSGRRSPGYFRGVDYPGMGQPRAASLKSLRTALHSLLNVISEEKFTLSEAQELLAQILQFNSWNHLRAQEKSRGELVGHPVALCAVKYFDDPEEGEYTKELAVEYHLSLASGIFAYGQSMKRHGYTNYSVDDYMGYSNFTCNGERENGVHGLVLRQLEVIEVDDQYRYIASVMSDTDDLSDPILEYFKVHADPKERIIAINKRFGGSEEDTIFLGDWVFWVSRDPREDFLYADRVSKLGKERRERNPAAALHKAALIRNGDGEYWLANDWNRKPQYLLEGLTDIEADELERRFISEENKRSNYEQGWQ